MTLRTLVFDLADGSTDYTVATVPDDEVWTIYGGMANVECTGGTFQIRIKDADGVTGIVTGKH